jgi:NADP-dependent 3-hydroxy acid dehydrogenase YdfG
VSNSVSGCVWITGASSGIGAAVAARFARSGAELVLVGRDAGKLDRTAASLSKTAKVHSLVMDLADPSSITAAAAKAAERITSLEALVHAAGTFTPGSALDGDRAALDEMFQVNVHAALELSRALLPQLERGRGTIVFINSTGVQRPQVVTGQYMAAKHALRGLADSLREEVNSRGVRVTTVYPGRTATPMQESLYRAENRAYHPERLLQPEDVAEVVECAIRLPKTAEVVDLFVRPMMHGKP